jgi:hypothetical protein
MRFLTISTMFALALQAMGLTISKNLHQVYNDIDAHKQENHIHDDDENEDDYDEDEDDGLTTTDLDTDYHNHRLPQSQITTIMKGEPTSKIDLI